MDSPVSKSTAKKGLNIFMWIIIFILLVVFVYWYMYVRGINMRTVKVLVADASKKYKDPASVEKLLLTGVKEIITSGSALKQARSYAKSTGIPIEQVLVDNAVAIAKSLNYIQ